MIRVPNKDELNILKSILMEHFNVNYEDNELRHIYVDVDDSIRGFIVFTKMYERAEIEYIFVNENFRKNNIATNLISFMEELVKKDGILSISLEVNINNEAAINLYQKKGFWVVSKRSNYYDGVDGVVMIKDLVV